MSDKKQQVSTATKNVVQKIETVTKNVTSKKELPVVFSNVKDVEKIVLKEIKKELPAVVHNVKISEDNTAPPIETIVKSITSMFHKVKTILQK